MSVPLSRLRAVTATAVAAALVAAGLVATTTSASAAAGHLLAEGHPGRVQVGEDVGGHHRDQREGAGHVQPDHAPPRAAVGQKVTRRILSSPDRGVVRPSRLLVVIHRLPSGAAATDRIRP